MSGGSRLLPTTRMPAAARVSLVHHGDMWMDARRLAASNPFFQRVNSREPSNLWRSFPVFSVVIQHSESVIVFDTGCATNYPKTWGESGISDLIDYRPRPSRSSMEEALKALRLAPKDISVVVVSHMHMDHAGGLEAFDGTGVPVWVQSKELRHATAVTGKGGAYIRKEFEDLDLNWAQIDGDRELVSGIAIVSLPGHSPGSQGMSITSSGGKSVIFAADAIQVKENIEGSRPVQSGGVYDSVAWRRTVMELMEAEKRGAFLAMGHEPTQLAPLTQILDQISSEGTES